MSFISEDSQRIIDNFNSERFSAIQAAAASTTITSSAAARPSRMQVEQVKLNYQPQACAIPIISLPYEPCKPTRLSSASSSPKKNLSKTIDAQFPSFKQKFEKELSKSIKIASKNEILSSSLYQNPRKQQLLQPQQQQQSQLGQQLQMSSSFQSTDRMNGSNITSFRRIPASSSTSSSKVEITQPKSTNEIQQQQQQTPLFTKTLSMLQPEVLSACNSLVNFQPILDRPVSSSNLSKPASKQSNLTSSKQINNLSNSLVLNSRQKSHEFNNYSQSMKKVSLPQDLQYLQKDSISPSSKKSTTQIPTVTSFKSYYYPVNNRQANSRSLHPSPQKKSTTIIANSEKKQTQTSFQFVQQPQPQPSLPSKNITRIKDYTSLSALSKISYESANNSISYTQKQSNSTQRISSPPKKSPSVSPNRKSSQQQSSNKSCNSFNSIIAIRQNSQTDLKQTTTSTIFNATQKSNTHSKSASISHPIQSASTFTSLDEDKTALTSPTKAKNKFQSHIPLYTSLFLPKSHSNIQEISLNSSQIQSETKKNSIYQIVNLSAVSLDEKNSQQQQQSNRQSHQSNQAELTNRSGDITINSSIQSEPKQNNKSKIEVSKLIAPPQALPVLSFSLSSIIPNYNSSNDPEQIPFSLARSSPLPQQNETAKHSARVPSISKKQEESPSEKSRYPSNDQTKFTDMDSILKIIQTESILKSGNQNLSEEQSAFANNNLLGSSSSSLLLFNNTNITNRMNKSLQVGFSPEDFNHSNQITEVIPSQTEQQKQQDQQQQLKSNISSFNPQLSSIIEVQPKRIDAKIIEENNVNSSEIPKISIMSCTKHSQIALQEANTQSSMKSSMDFQCLSFPKHSLLSQTTFSKQEEAAAYESKKSIYYESPPQQNSHIIKELPIQIYPNNEQVNEIIKEQEVVATVQEISQKQNSQLECTISKPAEIPQEAVLPKKQYDQKDYNFIKYLGQGKHSEVFLAEDKLSGFLMAIKQVHKGDLLSENMEDQFANEVKIQMLMNHPNIIQMYGFYEDDKYFYLLTEYAPDGEISRILKRSSFDDQVRLFSEEEAAFYLLQLASALEFLHRHNIIHRDLKPENILLSNGVLKLGDFGYSIRCGEQDSRRSFCGTLDYLSPKIVKGEDYNREIDIWSFGVIAYEFLQGIVPFYEDSKEETMRKIAKGKFEFVYPISLEAQLFIQDILKLEKPYLSMEQIIRHPWLNENSMKFANNSSNSDLLSFYNYF